MPGARTVLCLVSLSLLALVAQERTASAEDPKTEYADGLKACEDFHAKNERELAAWAKTQPPVPYAYPREDNVLGAPWGPITGGIGSSAELLLASIIPHFGAQLRGQTPAAVVAWPWSIPIGPGFTCSRKQGTFTVHDFRSNRLMLEPGLVSSNRGTGVYVRPGYRFLYHPSDWVVGVGAGVGSTIELAGNREPPGRPSVSPEVVIQFGHCCESSYFTLTFRYDHYFAGDSTNILGGSLGYTFF
ncbi:MAG TPA: hypothetical protein VLT33_33235 [Labilithrix sp.]|nr:hypothetical protein [Labilithrix sp.]